MRYKLHFAVLILVFATMVVGACGQDTARQPVMDASGIFEKFKPSAVDVQTMLTLESGEILEARGSGTFIDSEGTILTAAHVVKEQGDQIPMLFGPPLKITAYDYWVTVKAKNRRYHAELTGVNVANDSALLKAQEIAPSDYAPAKLGNSDEVRVGMKVYAIGNTFGVLSNSLTSGQVSGLHRRLGADYLEDFIQSDVSIQPGNSGGALINEKGELIGINTRGARSGGNLALSVPINFINMAQLKKGEVALPWFGLEALVDNFPRSSGPDSTMFEDLAFLNRLTGIRSAEQLKALAKVSYTDHWAIVGMVEEIKRGDKVAPAKKCGMKRGDLITAMAGKPIQDGMDVRKAAVEIGAGKEFEIEFLRVDKDGVVNKMTCKMTLEKKPEMASQGGGHNH